MHQCHRLVAGLLLFTGLCALYGCIGPVAEPATQATPPSQVQRALNFLATQQNPDGSWGEAATNRPLLTALATLAYLKHGDTPASEPYGKTVTHALDFVLSETRSTNDASPLARMTPDSTSATVWCLAETCGITQNPNVRAVLLSVLQNWKPGGSLPFDYHASLAIHLDEIETNSAERLRQVSTAILAQVATNQLELAMQIQAAHRVKQHKLSETLSSNLWVSCSNGWPRGEYPIATIAAISRALYYYTENAVSIPWNRMFVPTVAQYQIRCETNGWWTSQSFGIQSSKELALFTPHDERIYTTAMIIMAHPPRRCLPIFHQIDAENLTPASTDADMDTDIKVIIR